MAVAMDLGNPYSPFHSLHPTNKNDVGKRLALASLAVAYGKNVYFTGPLVSEIKQIKEHSLNCLKVTFRSVLYKIEVRCRDGFEVYGHSLSLKISRLTTRNLLVKLNSRFVVSRCFKKLNFWDYVEFW